LFGYYLLPEGFMRGSPTTAVARLSVTDMFWSEFALTLLFNLGMVVVIGVLSNLIQVKGFSFGYLWLLGQGVFTRLVSGTNSFVASDMKRFNAWDGMALGISIGELEMIEWAKNKGLQLLGSAGDRGRRVYTTSIADNLFKQLNKKTKEEPESGDGGELNSKAGKPAKIQALHSSSC